MEKTLDYLSFLADNITNAKKIQMLEQLDFQNIQVLNESYLFLEEKILKDFSSIDCIDGTIYRMLINSDNSDILDRLHTNFSGGLVDPKSQSQFHGVYLELQDLLLNNDFQKADKLTSRILCLLANTVDRNWLYFSDIKQISFAELLILDNLWKTYSNGKFGFSIQRQIWLANDEDWNLLWDKIGWRQGGTLCRYPEDFIWDIEAPIGHLPLSNQLRGVQTLKALFNLPLWY
nr:Ycf53 [Erythrotrichia longistipitata]